MLTCVSTVQLARIMMVPISMFYGKRSITRGNARKLNISPERVGSHTIRLANDGGVYSSAAPNKALHAATAIVIQPRVSGAQDTIVAALNVTVLSGVDAVGDVEEGEVAVDGAVVTEKETVTLSTAQNCLARFSAEGTLALQLPRTQEYSESGNSWDGQ